MTILAFIVALSIIVAVHEYGHYIVGRWSGIKAEVFSLGFGPVLFSRMDRHGTRWQVAALPFGGYVKFLGDADAASGKDGAAMAGPAARAAAPDHARRAALGAHGDRGGGAGVQLHPVDSGVRGCDDVRRGKTAEPLTVGELKPLPVEGVTLQPGDEILSVAGAPRRISRMFEVYDAFLDTLPVRRCSTTRCGATDDRVTVQGPHPYASAGGGLSPQSAAFDAGLKAGDVITAVNGTPVVAFSELKEIVEGSNGAPLALRCGATARRYETTLTPRRVDEPQPEGGFETEWRIGVAGAMAFEPATEALGPVEALGAAVTQTGISFEARFRASTTWSPGRSAVATCPAPSASPRCRVRWPARARRASSGSSRCCRPPWGF